ncbi:MAG: hypothetical protein K0S86_5857 [Geminicoccaceae bacterium]|nr:hypothetical protein [Geminicoccaceae bacterium]
MNGVTCTAADCPCTEFRNLGPAIEPLIADQRGTDSIVFPMVAGTLAQCVLVSARRQKVTLVGVRVATLVEHARLIIDLADAGDGPRSWGRDRDAFATVVSFVLAGWDVLLDWVPEHYVPLVAEWREPTTAALVKAARAWVDRTRTRTLTELVLFSADVANRLVPTTPDPLPIITKAMRPIRVEFAARLRANGLTTWPRVLHASVHDWQADALGNLLLDYASVGNMPLGVDTTLKEEMAWEDDEADDVPPPDAPAADMDADTVRAREPLGANVEALLQDAIAHLDRAEARSRAIEAKRIELADRYASLQGRVDHLTTDLASARHEITGLRLELAAVLRERDELAGRVVSND